MVTTKESRTCQEFSAWNLPYLDHMALLQREQNSSLPYFPPPAFTAGVAFPGQPNSNVCCLNSGHPNAVDGSLKPLPPYWNNTSYPSGNPCLKDFQSAPQKRFLIFDRSGNHTRLFFSPSFPPKDQMIASETPAIASRIDHQFLVKPIVDEKWDESHLNDEEDEMLEDSEEIDALLYSDSDDDEYDDNNDADSEKDGATSTRDFTFITNKEGFDKDKLLEEFVEEVASSDDSPKRQRLIDGRYKKSSLVRLSSHENDDAESSYAGAINSGEDTGFSKREKKVKVCKALKILESIIPGLQSNDPLSIIDKAIVYLESMKVEAEALGVGYRECVTSAGLT